MRTARSTFVGRGAAAGAAIVMACLAFGAGEAPAATRFAVVGDLGSTVPTAASPVGPIVTAVADRVKAGDPDCIITVGDNCHDAGGGAPYGYFDIDVGQYFHEFIGGYAGTYGAGAPTNRFWPALGNHDYADGLSYYQAFFPALGNKRYYDFAQGAAHFFILNGDEPGGSSPTSAQGLWLQGALAASTSPWNFVFIHYPPYTSSNRHPPSTEWRWNYKAWGADAVFSGHVHAYERLVENGLTYFTTGPAGETLATGHSNPMDPGSRFFYNGDHGAIQVEVDGTRATFQYVTQTGQVLDASTQAVAPNPWASAAGGSYNAPGNWTRGRSVSAPDAVADLLGPVSGAITVDAPVTLGRLNLYSPGGCTVSGPAAVRLETTGGAGAMLSAQGGSQALSAPLVLAASATFEVLDHSLTLSAGLDDAAGLAITKTGAGALTLSGTQTYGPGALFSILDGTVFLDTDAGASAANLSVFVTDAVLSFGSDQHLDTLTIGDGGAFVFAGAYVVVLNHLVIGGVDFGPTTLTPEPATLALLAVGAVGLWRRRRRKYPAPAVTLLRQVGRRRGVCFRRRPQSRNSRRAKSCRCFRHTCHSCVPSTSNQTWRMPAFSSFSWKSVRPAGFSCRPQPSQSRRHWALALAASASAPPKDVAGSKFLSTPLRPPMALNRSGCLSPTRSACIAPIDSPATARWVRSASVR